MNPKKHAERFGSRLSSMASVSLAGTNLLLAGTAGLGAMAVPTVMIVATAVFAPPLLFLEGPELLKSGQPFYLAASNRYEAAMDNLAMAKSLHDFARGAKVFQPPQSAQLPTSQEQISKMQERNVPERKEQTPAQTENPKIAPLSPDENQHPWGQLKQVKPRTDPPKVKELTELEIVRAKIVNKLAEHSENPNIRPG